MCQWLLYGSVVADVHVQRVSRVWSYEERDTVELYTEQWNHTKMDHAVTL